MGRNYTKPYKHMSIPEKIEHTKTQIEDTTLRLEELKVQLADLEQEYESQQFKELSDLMSKSGLTIDDVKSIIVNHPQSA